MNTKPAARKPADISDHPVILAIHERLDSTDNRINKMEAELSRNTAMTADVHEWLDLGRSGLRVLGILGKLFGWLVGVAAGVSAIYGGWHNWLKK